MSATVEQFTDSQAVARVLVAEALSVNPRATRRVRFVARRLVRVYEDQRAEGLGHAAAFAAAWHLVHGLAEQIAQQGRV